MRKNWMISSAISVLLVLLAGSFIAPNAQNLPSLRIATGGEQGTYYAMAMNMATYCGQGLLLNVQKTGGSDDNIERLTSRNQADVGIVQKDILFKRLNYNKDVAVGNLLAVMPLHYEAMHLVVLEGSGLTKFSELGGVKGGFMNYGAKTAKKVGAWGGSIESAEIVRDMTGINFDIVVVENAGAAVSALNAKQIDAILAMGGTPLQWVDEKLKRGQHRFLSFDVPMERVERAYKRVSITYTKLGVNAIPSIATDAVLVTRNFSSVEKVRAVSLLRKCIQTELVRMQEADDTHGQWGNVQKDGQVSGWAVFPGMQVTWPPSTAANKKY